MKTLADLDVTNLNKTEIIIAFLKRAWIIALAAIIGFFGGYIYGKNKATTSYSSTVLIWVNSSNVSVGSTTFTINTSGMKAAANMIPSYRVILKNKTTLNMILSECDSEIAAKYDSSSLNGAISVTAIEDTQVMQLTVTTGDPEDSAYLANKIAEVLPERIEDIMEGCAIKIIDAAVANYYGTTSGVLKAALKGMIAVAAVAAIVILLILLLDDRIFGTDFVTNNFNYPILAVIPEMTADSSKHGYGYGYGYGYGHHHHKTNETQTTQVKPEASENGGDNNG